jgi:ketosteroid isomerase-like protein
MVPDRETSPEDRGAPGMKPVSRRELLQRRVMAVVILVAIAIAIMALADAAPFFDDVTEEQRVTDVVERFFAAYQEGDYAAVCDLFSDEVSRAIAQVGATETKEGEPKGCAAVLEARFGAAGGEDQKLRVKIENVRVSGPRAVAQVVVKSEEVPKGRDLPVELERNADGEWLITRQVITS